MNDNVWGYYCKIDGCFEHDLRDGGLCVVHQLPKDNTWEKHMSAEKPGELYWNEVTGIGNVSDHYRIVELEEELAFANARIDYLEEYEDKMGIELGVKHNIIKKIEQYVEDWDSHERTVWQDNEDHTITMETRIDDMLRLFEPLELWRKNNG